MTDRQIDSLDKSGIQSSGEAQFLQGDRESGHCSKAHHVRDPYQLAPPIALFHLAVDQTCRHLPLAHSPPSAALEPVAKMSRQSIEVHI
jgi:hypothetical protein